MLYLTVEDCIRNLLYSRVAIGDQQIGGLVVQVVHVDSVDMVHLVVVVVDQVYYVDQPIVDLPV